LHGTNGVSGHCGKQLDKLSTIDKYDALYASRFAKNIDRGSAPFQVVAELFGFRNRYVHPKLAKIAVRISIDDKGSKRYEKDAEQQKKASHLALRLRNVDRGTFPRCRQRNDLVLQSLL
jgi:hypothetical protein